MKKWFLLGLLLLATLSAQAQDRSSATFGLDPADREAMARMRRRSDRIRKNRPVVALVLSGGGAKGAAHVGALQFMQQYDIPIDMVVGTSVGGLLGGFYALGYSPDELEELITGMDWNVMLTDNVPDKYIPYSRRAYDEKYVLSFPFYYGRRELEARIQNDLGFAGEKDGRLHLSADGKNAAGMLRENLIRSLPSGFVYGQNVELVISALTAGYSEDTDFFSLPIPFVCVATDLVSGKAKVWHHGSLQKALRSTMSIPGLFAPVRTGGMVLVDGGMRNNFPVDIARDMGADIVIGVDLSNETPSAAGSVNNLADIVWKGIDMLSNDSFDRNVKAVDVRIKPDVTGYNMMSFNSESMDTLRRRGYAAAKEQAEKLAAVKRWVGRSSFRLNAPKAVDLRASDVLIDSVEVTGVSESEAAYLRSKLGFGGGDLVSREAIEEAVMSIYGQGSYDFINYELLATGGPFRLRINCKKGPLHRLGVGFRMDSEELVSILLNLGLYTNSISGSALDMSAKIGSNPSLDFHYFYNRPHLPTLNARVDLRWNDRNRFLGTAGEYSISFFSTSQQLYFSNINWSRFDVQVGLKNEFINVRRLLTDDLVGDYSRSLRKTDYPSAFVNARIESLDNKYFPRTGASAGIRYDLVSRLLDGPDYPAFFGILSLDGKMPVSIGKYLTLIPSGQARFIFGDDIPIPYANILGGEMAGRYMPHQIPMPGIAGAAFRRNFLVQAQSDLRVRVARNHYLTASGAYAYDFETVGEFEDGEGVWGASLGYGYDSVVGPIRASILWSSLTGGLGLYFSLGFDF